MFSEKNNVNISGSRKSIYTRTQTKIDSPVLESPQLLAHNLFNHSNEDNKSESSSEQKFSKNPKIETLSPRSSVNINSISDDEEDEDDKILFTRSSSSTLRKKQLSASSSVHTPRSYHSQTYMFPNGYPPQQIPPPQYMYPYPPPQHHQHPNMMMPQGYNYPPPPHQQYIYPPPYMYYNPQQQPPPPPQPAFEIPKGQSPKINFNAKSPEIPRKPTLTHENDNKKPDYENMSPEELNKARIKLEDLFKKLIASYPGWLIQEPKYYEDDVELIHDRYETIVKRIIIYQCAQKWKVYIAIVIAGIEYFGYVYFNWEIMKDFTKLQLKTLYKYDEYLIELAGKWYDESEENWPFILRALGTMGSNIFVFAAVNFLCSIVGFSGMKENIYQYANDFISDGNMNANLKSNLDISEVPEPPEGLTDPNKIISIIESSVPFLIKLKSQKKTGEPIPESVSSATPQPAEPASQPIPTEKEEKNNRRRAREFFT